MPVKFYGQQGDKILERLVNKWLPEGPPVAILQGFPGCGKTQLARAVAKEAPESLDPVVPSTEAADPVLDLYLDLAIALDAHNVPSLVLEINKSDKVRLDKVLLDVLRHKPILIVVDEFQRLLSKDNSTPPDLWVRLIEDLNNSHHALGRLLLISNRLIKTERWSENCHVEEIQGLPDQEAELFLAELLESQGLERTVPTGRRREVVHRLAGNPRALKTLVLGLRTATLDDLLSAEPDLWKPGDVVLNPSLAEIAARNFTNSKRVRRNVKRSTKNHTVKTQGSKEVIDDSNALPATVSVYSEPSTSSEFETTLKVLDRLRQDFGPTAEANTALLLYTLLQTPGLIAHSYLGMLEPELRAKLVVEALQSAQGKQNGISTEHIRYAARRVAIEICNDSCIDSRHLLLVCMVGSGWLARPPELPVLSTEWQNILGYSNFAVRAMRFAGIDPVEFLERVKVPKSELSQSQTPFPGFFIFWQQHDRTRVLRVEEVGEFYHQPAKNIVYPATLGLLDNSIGKPLTSLLEFEDLINDPSAPEAAYQRFFEKHPEFLFTDQHVAAKAGVLLHSAEGFGLKPDFFLQRRDAPLWDIAELKLPSEQLVQGRPARRGLAAAVRWGMDQLQRYREYFLDSGLADRFRETHGLEVYHPKLTLIIGRDDAFGTYRERQRLTPPESRILTYDDLLRLAKHRSLVLPFIDPDPS